VARKIALISSHPIQNNLPFFVLMVKGLYIDLMILYIFGEST
jgi:hypothetical protein